MISLWDPYFILLRSIWIHLWRFSSFGWSKSRRGFCDFTDTSDTLHYSIVFPAGCWLVASIDPQGFGPYGYGHALRWVSWGLQPAVGHKEPRKCTRCS